MRGFPRSMMRKAAAKVKTRSLPKAIRIVELVRKRYAANARGEVDYWLWGCGFCCEYRQECNACIAYIPCHASRFSLDYVHNAQHTDYEGRRKARIVADALTEFADVLRTELARRQVKGDGK